MYDLIEVILIALACPLALPLVIEKEDTNENSNLDYSDL